jgi:hypothetical protein
MSFIRQPQLFLRQIHTRIIPISLRYFHATMSGNAQSGNAQYTESAAVAPDLTEKLSAVRGFISKRKAVMLTTHAPNGDLHSRCMAIGEITPDWKFRFLYDRDSYWDKEIENE